jgi:glutaryl-CoA dehydrogenase
MSASDGGEPGFDEPPVPLDGREAAWSIEPMDEPEPGCAAIDRLVGWSEHLDDRAQRARAAVRELLITHWLPTAAEHFFAGKFPRELFRELGRAGAFGTTVVGHNGGAPLGKLATCAIMHAIEYGDGGLRCAATIQDSVLQALARFGDDAQQRRWLAPLAKGEAVAAFALTEPDAGSDLRSLSASASRRGGDWVLSGHKSWVTNGPAADLLLVWARTSERADAIRGFLVERQSQGLTIEPIPHALGMRAATLGRMTLDGVRVPLGAVLPHAWGLADVNACLDYNRLTVAFGVMGAARFCLDAAIRHAHRRRQFGVPIGAKQLVQAQLAQMTSDVVAGEVLAMHVARRWERGPLAPMEVSLVKRTTCTAALDVARRARALFGARGVDLDEHIMRHLLNLEASFTYGGSSEIHALVMGRALTGESAF